MAVGVASVANAERLVYLSISKRKRGPFYVNLELPAAPGDDRPYTPRPGFDDVAFDELAEIVAAHLEMQALGET